MYVPVVFCCTAKQFHIAQWGGAFCVSYIFCKVADAMLFWGNTKGQRFRHGIAHVRFTISPPTLQSRRMQLPSLWVNIVSKNIYSEAKCDMCTIQCLCYARFFEIWLGSQRSFHLPVPRVNPITPDSTVWMAAVMAWFLIAPIKYTPTHADFWSVTKGWLYFGNTSVSSCRMHSRQALYHFPVPWTQSNTTLYSWNIAAGQALLL